MRILEIKEGDRDIREWFASQIVNLHREKYGEECVLIADDEKLTERLKELGYKVKLVNNINEHLKKDD